MSKSKQIPFEFVIENLISRDPVVKPMFGCHAIYIGDKILLITRKKDNNDMDNGVWVAVQPEHHSDLKKIFPSLRPVEVLGEKSIWLNLPDNSDDFEQSVNDVCAMILKNDPRIGKVPKSKKKKKSV